MSKTYRRSMLQLDCNCGAPIEPGFGWNTRRGVFENFDKTMQWANSRGVPPERTCECEVKYDYYSRRNLKRDRKNPWRPDKGFKDVSRKIFKAKARHAMVQEKYDCMPVSKNTDIWDWN